MVLLTGEVGARGVMDTRREYGGGRGLAGESGPEAIRRFEGFRGENLCVKPAMLDVGGAMEETNRTSW